MCYTKTSQKQDFIAYRDPWILYTGGHTGTARHAAGTGALPYHEPTAGSTEHQVGNHLSDEVTAPGLQLTQVDALTTQMGIILSELRHEVQVLVSIPNELDCLTPGDGAVSVRGWKGHRVVCCCTNHTTERVKTPGPPHRQQSPPTGPHGPAATSERFENSCSLCSTPEMPSHRCCW